MTTADLLDLAMLLEHLAQVVLPTPRRTACEGRRRGEQSASVSRPRPPAPPETVFKSWGPVGRPSTPCSAVWPFIRPPHHPPHPPRHPLAPPTLHLSTNHRATVAGLEEGTPGRRAPPTKSLLSVLGSDGATSALAGARPAQARAGLQQRGGSRAIGVQVAPESGSACEKGVPRLEWQRLPPPAVPHSNWEGCRPSKCGGLAQ